MFDVSTVSNRVIGAAIEVHRSLGPGLLESAYGACLAVELTEAGLAFRREVPLPIRYKGRAVDAAYRLDFVVEDRLIIEVKCVDRLHPIHSAQVITYLRLGGWHEALLMNFNAPTLRDGLKRFVR